MQDRYMRRGRPRIVGIERRRPDPRPDPDGNARESPDDSDPRKPDDT